jgi:hypothetical protein
LTFSNPKSAQHYRDVVLDWRGDEYGWEFGTFLDPQSKLSYYLTALPSWFSVMQKQEYAKRHKIPEEYGQYSFIFKAPKDIAAAKKNNDPYGMKYYKEIDSENIKFIKDLVYERLSGIYEFLKKQGCNFNHFQLYLNSKCITTDEGGFLEVLQRLKDSKDVEWKDKPNIYDWIYFGGYIDHQSAPSEDAECRRLAGMCPGELLDWIFGDGFFETGNDNYCD